MKQKHNKYLQNTSINIIMCGYFCTGFIDFMLKGKSLLDYTNNTKIFSITKRLRSKKYIVLLVLSIKK